MPPVNFIASIRPLASPAQALAPVSQSKIVGQKTPITAKFEDKKPRFMGCVVSTHRHLKNEVACKPLNEP